MKFWVYARNLFLCTVLGMVGWAVLDLLGLRSEDWSKGGVVSVGDDFAIQLLTRCSSPLGMAEYDQRLQVYRKAPRNGRSLGVVDLFPNTGGRTHTLIYTYVTTDGQRRVQIQDRYGIEDVDLNTVSVTNHFGGDHNSRSRVDPEPSRNYVGTYSGESYPLRFISPSVLSEQDSIAHIARK